MLLCCAVLCCDCGVACMHGCTQAWRWYYEVVGNKQCAVVDTFWQTETGGIMISPLPGCTPMKPGAASLPLFGIEPVLIDGAGHVVHGNDQKGVLCMRQPWPGMARTVHGDHHRFMATYLHPYKGYYFTGDGSTRDKDGYYWITGRVDGRQALCGVLCAACCAVLCC
jgi:acetyl-CoA synthetase